MPNLRLCALYQSIIACSVGPEYAIEGIESNRCVDSEGLLAQTEIPKRLVILGGGVIGCEFASIFQRFGSNVTIVEMLRSLIPQEDADASNELAKQFSKRGITLHFEKKCAKVENSGSELTVHFGEGESIKADLMLFCIGRAPLVEGIGLGVIGVKFDKRRGIAADKHRRTTVPHIYAVGDCAGYWQLAHTAFRRARSPRRTPVGTTPRSTTAPSRARSTRTRRSPASVSRRRRHASSTATISRPESSRGSPTPAP